MEVPQPSSPTQTHVANKAASTCVNDRHGGAATTVSSLEAGQGSRNIHKTPTMPHDSPLLRVHTLGSNKGRMQPNELMELVTKLSDRVAVLENDLNKARRRAQFVVSNDEEDDSFNQGRKITKIDEDPDISLVYTAEPNISTANVPVSNGGAEVSIVAESLVYISRSAAKRKDKGKAIMEESKPTHRPRLKYSKNKKGLASTLKPKEYDNMKAQIEADEELAFRFQAEEREGYSKADKAKLLHMGSHTLQQLRGYSFDEIKLVFKATVKRVNTFTPTESDDTVPKVVAGSSKRSEEEELGEESSNR
ncbi:hypothetical protein Tco_0409621 [Tanacetum coccineum]